jgi:hypothetical protein
MLFCVNAQAQAPYNEAAVDHGVVHTYNVTGSQCGCCGCSGGCCGGCPCGGVAGGSAYGGGASFIDFNGDGMDDLTLATGNTALLDFYVNMNGEYVSVPAPIPNEYDARSVLWIDYDNDGDKDFFTTSYRSNMLYRNDGGFAFTDVTATAGLPTDSLPSAMSSWGDYDADGYLDFFVCNYSADSSIVNELYHNNGNGTFNEVGAAAGIDQFGGQLSLACAWFDYDNDNLLDLYVANDKYVSNTLYKNNGNGTFSNVSVASGSDIVIDAMSASIGDFDGNGYLDIYVTNNPAGNVLLQNNGNGTFSEASASQGVGFYSEGWAATFLDYDNDIDMDLYVSGGGVGTVSQSSELYENIGGGNFVETLGMLGDTVASYAHAIGDVNYDGSIDIGVVNMRPHRTHLWMNDGLNGNNWLKIRLEGTVSNRDAIGSWVHVYTQGNVLARFTHAGVGFLGQNSSTNTIGLGSAQLVDSVVITFPSGIVETVTQVDANQSVHIIEGGAAVTPISVITTNNSIHMCPGESVTLSSGGTYPTYEWSTGDTTASITTDSVGTYYLIVTNQWGEIDTSATVVTATTTPIIQTISGTDLSCFQANDGTATTSGVGGQGAHEYCWSSGNMNQNQVNLAAGTYIAMIIDEWGCMVMDSVTLIEPTELITVLVADSLSCNGDSDGSIDLTLTGGNGGYNYLWSNSSTNEDQSNLEAGMYIITASDVSGCVVTDSAEVYQPSLLSGTAVSNPIIGSNDGDATITAAGGTPPYTYLWDDAAMQTTATAVFSTAGTYSVTVTDANGCTYVEVVVISAIPFVGDIDLDAVQLGPNPANEHLMATFNPGLFSLITLTDALGREVLAVDITASSDHLQLRVGTLTTGVYFVTLHTVAGREITKKILVQRP